MNDYPIILAHGIARFDFLLANFIRQLGPLGPFIEVRTEGLHYFKGVARHLRREGFDVHHSSVSFAAGLPRRAADLREEVGRVLRATGKGKVHVVGHSMGGLDARYMIARLGMAGRVASLTTVGTPHLGTSLADWGLAHQGARVIRGLRRVIDLEGFLALTTGASREFNESSSEAEAANQVFYQTYASAQPRKKVFTPLKRTWSIIREYEGENDGLVSVASQRWVSELVSASGRRKQIRQHDFPVPADHLNEVGWWDVHEIDLATTPLLQLAESIARYESSIRDIYLRIARDVAALPARKPAGPAVERSRTSRR
ncbi:MAG: alpha/beta fold hydrolase [Acidobacteriota bacterium]|nr:alpha/beta fold hydrolase [Acidobacteriota bacterium]